MVREYCLYVGNSVDDVKADKLYNILSRRFPDFSFNLKDNRSTVYATPRLVGADAKLLRYYSDGYIDGMNSNV